MKKTAFLTLLLACCLMGAAQEIVQYKYWIGFTDKKNNSCSLDQPKSFLSTRAVDRRVRLGIRVDTTDLPVTQSYIDHIQLNGVTVCNLSRWFNGVTIYVSDTSMLAEIRGMSFVREVKLVGYEKLRAVFSVGFNPEELLALLEKRNKADTSAKPVAEAAAYSQAWYGDAWNQIAMCNGQRLHMAGFNGREIRIAVLDAGFLNYHYLQALKRVSVKQLIAQHDFVENNDTVSNDDDHGTNVLSCMAAYAPGRMVGTAPAADYLLLRSEDANSEFPVEEINWACAAEFADSAGADLVTTSVGYTVFDDKSMGHVPADLNGRSALISRAADMAVAKGMLVVCSAGNEGDGAWKKIGVPADAFNVFTIGSVNGEGKYSRFSSVGPTADGRIKPTLVTRGEMTLVLSPNDAFYRTNGTSFSTPVFAGMLACLYQANPRKTSQELMQALLMSGSNYNKPDNRIGYGIPDFWLANKILGGDKEHPLTGDDLLDVSVPVNSTFLTYTFHSGSTQQVEVFIRKAGNPKARYKSRVQVKQGETVRVFIKKYKKLKKGSYEFVLRSGAMEYKATFEKSDQK